jgi:hypothetical protein
MIAKGTTHNNGAKLADYMTTGKPGERAELWQLRGFASDDIKDAFRSVHVMAAATQCEKPLFHVQVRNPEGETLTREQWERVADRIESKLGYSDQPRAIAFHRDEDTGHEHMHIAWSRIDAESMTAQPLPFFKLRLKEVCRELESELKLTPVRNERESPVMAPSRDQDEQARRLGVNVREVRQTIRDCWERSDNGDSFRAALADEGLTLAKGDRRDYIVIDHEGGMHALGKRVLGTTAAETRARMADLDREQLPTVEQAREYLVMQREVQAPPTFAYHDSEHFLEREDALAKAAIEKEQVERQFVEPEASVPAKQPERELNETVYTLSDSAADRPNPANSNEIELVATEALEAAPTELAGAVSGIAEGMGDGLKVLGGIAALFGDNQPPPPQSKEEAQARKDARLARAERMLHDREYRARLDEEKKQHRAEDRKREDDDERGRTRQRY